MPSSLLASPQPPNGPYGVNSSANWRASAVLAGVLMVAARICWIKSDAYAGLSWSSALLTDEGFYIHNARNLVLFGHMRTDGFNNALIMPTLHYLQAAVFFVFGVGTVQARMISVVLSLLTVCVFFAAMRRAFDLKVAAISSIFLGLDHINVLYNRLALMDTPAAFIMVCVFYAWVRAGDRPAAAQIDRHRLAWLILCGLLLSAAYATRGLTALLIPVPFVLLLFQPGPANVRSAVFGSVALGLVLGFCIYGVCWLAPHGAELAQLNRYYLYHQLIPDSARHLTYNVEHAFFGDERGFSPYLFRHTPVQFVLAFFAVCYSGLARVGRGRVEPPVGQQVSLSSNFLMLWLTTAWAAFAVISYAPSRYYVLFYPALAGTAGFALTNINKILPEIGKSPVARASLGAFLAYHMVEIVLNRGNRVGELACYAVPFAVAVMLVFWPSRPAAENLHLHIYQKHIIVGCLALWSLVNILWLSDWIAHLSYRQSDADEWLANNLPIGTVLIGDVAPGLSMNNRLACVNVIPGLCNDDQPLEAFASHPRAIVILDGKFKESWWLKHYPAKVIADHRVGPLAPIVRWDVGIYPVR